MNFVHEFSCDDNIRPYPRTRHLNFCFRSEIRALNFDQEQCAYVCMNANESLPRLLMKFFTQLVAADRTNFRSVTVDKQITYAVMAATAKPDGQDNFQQITTTAQRDEGQGRKIPNRNRTNQYFFNRITLCMAY